MNLKTDYKNISWTGLRKYEMIDNGDGTVSFRDVTQYSNVEDSNILANVLNTANDAINRMMNGEIFYTEAEVDALLSLKQNLLTFDNAPTAGSNNPVKSSGIKTALDTINSRIDNLNVFSFYICGNGEYDPVTGQPTIQNPDPSTFYLVPTGTSPDVFTEWVYINNNWEKFGSTTVDLSNYVTTSDLQDALDDKQDVLTFDSTPTDNSQNPVTSDGIYDALSGKSDTGHDHDGRYYTELEVNTLLVGKSDTGHDHDDRYYTESEMDALLVGKSDTSSTYTSAQVDTLLSAKVDNTSIGSMAAEDDAPSDNKEYVRKNGDWSEATGGGGSVNWGNIGGTLSNQNDLQTALNAKQGTLTFDNSPTSGSSNPVKSGGVYTALAGKQATLTFDNSPTANSSNPVKSSGIKTALDNKFNLSGGNITGNIAIKKSDWDISSTISEAIEALFGFYDKNNRYLGYVRGREETNGNLYTELRARRYNSANIDNYLRLSISAAGDRSIVIPDAAIWRKALGLGDTNGAFPLTTAQGGTGGTDSGWKTRTNSSVFSGTIYYRNLGKITLICSSSLTLAAALTSSSGITIANLPEGYRPNSQNVTGMLASSYDSPATCTIGTSGNVNVYKHRSASELGTGHNFYLMFAYFNA